MGFMQETLIEKMNKMEDLEDNQIKNYPHLVINYYQKNIMNDECTNYIEDIIDRCP